VFTDLAVQRGRKRVIRSLANADHQRSVSEVLMHTASGNYFFLQLMGVKAGEDLPEESGKECDDEGGRRAMAQGVVRCGVGELSEDR